MLITKKYAVLLSDGLIRNVLIGVTSLNAPPSVTILEVDSIAELAELLNGAATPIDPALFAEVVSRLPARDKAALTSAADVELPVDPSNPAATATTAAASLPAVATSLASIPQPWVVVNHVRLPYVHSPGMAAPAPLAPERISLTVSHENIDAAWLKYSPIIELVTDGKHLAHAPQSIVERSNVGAGNAHFTQSGEPVPTEWAYAGRPVVVNIQPAHWYGLSERGTLRLPMSVEDWHGSRSARLRGISLRFGNVSKSKCFRFRFSVLDPKGNGVTDRVNGPLSDTVRISPEQVLFDKKTKMFWRFVARMNRN